MLSAYFLCGGCADLRSFSVLYEHHANLQSASVPELEVGMRFPSSQCILKTFPISSQGVPNTFPSL